MKTIDKRCHLGRGGCLLRPPLSLTTGHPFKRKTFMMTGVVRNVRVH